MSPLRIYGREGEEMDEKDRIINIQKSKSRKLRNNFLISMKNEAFKSAYIYCRKKLGREPTEEEFSIALEGMNEAIDKYDQKKNASFLTFASKVIFSRLIDFFRREKKIRNYAIPHPNIAMLSDWWSINEYNVKQFTEDLREELIEAQKILFRYGYTWFEVLENKPKHSDSLARLFWLAYNIANSGLGEHFLNERYKEVRKVIEVDRRTLKKYRPYLCALIISYTYDLPIIKNYLERRRKHAST